MQGPDNTKRSPWFLLWLVIPLYFFTMFFRMAPSVMAGDLSADFGVQISDLSIMSSMTFVAYGLMQLPSGLLVDALGARRTICLLTLVAAAANFWFASCTGLSDASMSRFLLGMGCAITVPCSAMLAHSFSADAYGRANSYFLTIGIVGTVCAGAPLLWLCHALGWRVLMGCCGLLSVMFAAMCWFLMKEPAPKPGKSCASMLAELMRGVVQVVTCKQVWPVALWFTLGLAVYFSMGGLWWAPWLIKGCGLSPDAAGSVISMSYIIAIPGQYILMTWSDRVRSRKKVMAWCMVITFAAMTALSLFGPQMGPVLLTIQGGCFAIFVGSTGCLAFVCTRELFPVEMFGTAIGVVQTFPYLVGTPILQKLFGLVVDWRYAATGDHALAYSQAGLLNLLFVGLALLMALLATETFAKKGR